MKKITSVSESLIAKSKLDEGFEPKPYKCPGGEWTIGYGTTRYFDTKKRVTQFAPAIDKIEADRLLRGHYNTVVHPVVDALCRDDLNQNEFDAVADFVYNAGATYLDKKGKVQYYNLFTHVNNKMALVPLTAYWQSLAITARGKRLSGLIKRRKFEVQLYFKK